MRAFGSRIGENVHVYPTAQVEMPWNLIIGRDSAIGDGAIIYNLGRVRIGRRVTISQRAHLCAGSHDYEDVTMTLLTPEIAIGDDSWICTEAYIGPGVSVGVGAVAAARAVVVHDVADWSVVGGNPARTIKKRVLRR